MITWSYTGRSSSRPASTSCRVTARSSAEGVGSPLGWVCTTMIPAAASAIAGRDTSPGGAGDRERVTSAAPRPQENGQELLPRECGGADAPKTLARAVVLGVLGKAERHGEA